MFFPAANGVVLATEKKQKSILYDERSVHKVEPITKHIGLVYSGMGPDYRYENISFDHHLDPFYYENCKKLVAISCFFLSICHNTVLYDTVSDIHLKFFLMYSIPWQITFYLKNEISITQPYFQFKYFRDYSFDEENPAQPVFLHWCYARCTTP